MTETTDTASSEAPASPDAESRRVSPVEIIVGAVCMLAIVAVMVVALGNSDIPLFEGHTFEILSDAWTRTATIGVIIALVVVVLVAIFVWALARSTIGSDTTDD